MIYVPWRLRKLAADVRSSVFYLNNRLRHAFGAPPSGNRTSVLFCVPFYGYTGGSFAVLSVANLLSETCDVSFLTKASNVMNKYVARKVRMVGGGAGKYDFCIVETGTNAAAIAEMKGRSSGVILTCHGAPPSAEGTRNHGYADKEIDAAILSVDSVQHVSDVQLPLFEAYPAIHLRKIPNFVVQVGKTSRGRAVGVVCDTTLPHKNAEACVTAAALSAADRIEIWGKFRDKRSTERIRWNGFSGDKHRIYESFDVLVHLSRLENQPLVILEALSAGIPCVLADLPAYADFRGIPGIFLVDANDAASQAIDMALDCPEEVRQGLIRVWDENYSPRGALARWMRYFDEVRNLKAAPVPAV